WRGCWRPAGWTGKSSPPSSRAATPPAPSSGSAWRRPSASPRTKSSGGTASRWNTCTATGRSSAARREGASPGLFSPAGGVVMEANKSVDELCREHGIDHKQLAERSGLDEQRVLAIVLGRWTPSPAERDKVAAVFGLTRDQITWGHKTPIQHIYGHGPA